MIATITVVGAQLARPLPREMPANVPTKDFTLVAEAKKAAGFPISAKFPINRLIPANWVVATAAVT